MSDIKQEEETAAWELELLIKKLENALKLAKILKDQALNSEKVSSND